MINCVALYYDMDGKSIDIDQWCRSNKRHERSLGNDIIGDYRVSTVHVGLDLSIFPGLKPVIFETMIFGPKGSQLDMWIDRYTSKFSALIGHEYACRLARGEVVETDSGEME